MNDKPKKPVPFDAVVKRLLATPPPNTKKVKRKDESQSLKKKGA